MRIIRRRNKWNYTYDYTNEKFLQFFRSRTGIQIGFEDNPDLARFFVTDPNADRWIRKSKEFCYTTGKMVPFGNPREGVIRWVTILRDNLQKNWELFKNQPRKIRRRKKVRKIRRRSK